mgnify:CR=1 FL=1
MDSIRLFRHLFLVLSLFAGMAAWHGAYAEDVAGKPAQSASTININSASADEIAGALNGVGLTKAEAIVSYRKENGPFKTLADLEDVKGIGEKTLEKNKAIIAF